MNTAIGRNKSFKTELGKWVRFTRNWYDGCSVIFSGIDYTANGVCFRVHSLVLGVDFLSQNRAILNYHLGVLSLYEDLV